MVKMIFFDVDGTLINSRFEIDPSTLDTLIKLKQKGYLLNIATGRSYDSLLRTKLLDLLAWDGIICNNGQLVLNEKQGILQRVLIPSKTVKQFLKIAKSLNYPVVVKCQDRFISQVADDNTKKVHQHFNNTIPPIGHFTTQEVEAMNIYAPKSYDYQDFNTLTDIDIIPCTLDYAEISPKGISKASAIHILLDYYKQNEFIAFGDSPNDIAMLKVATIAVVMGQSEEKVKHYATYITTNIGDNAISNACTHLKL